MEVKQMEVEPSGSSNSLTFEPCAHAPASRTLAREQIFPTEQMASRRPPGHERVNFELAITYIHSLSYSLWSRCAHGRLERSFMHSHFPNGGPSITNVTTPKFQAFRIIMCDRLNGDLIRACSSKQHRSCAGGQPSCTI
jgi:hypothetical protein